MHRKTIREETGRMIQSRPSVRTSTHSPRLGWCSRFGDVALSAASQGVTGIAGAMRSSSEIGVKKCLASSGNRQCDPDSTCLTIQSVPSTRTSSQAPRLLCLRRVVWLFPVTLLPRQFDDGYFLVLQLVESTGDQAFCVTGGQWLSRLFAN